MKIHTEIVTPAGQKALLFRTNAPELTILRACVAVALKNTPRTKETEKVIIHMRNILRGFGRDAVINWESENVYAEP